MLCYNVYEYVYQSAKANAAPFPKMRLSNPAIGREAQLLKTPLNSANTHPMPVPMMRVCLCVNHLPGQTKLLPMPKPAPRPVLLDSLMGRLATVPWALTPATMRSRFVSMTMPPTIISLRVACSVSKLKMRSSSQTFSNSLSKASTYTWMRSSRASGDSVDVEMTMK